MQFYLVSGGYYSYSTTFRGIGSTEILRKEGGTSWQTVSSLPSARYSLGGGVSLPNGHFMVSGEFNSLHVLWVVTSWIMMRPYRWIYSNSCAGYAYVEWRVGLWSWCGQVDQGGPDGHGPQCSHHEPRPWRDCWLLCLITWHGIVIFHF